MAILILPSVYLMTGGVNSASLCYSQRLNMHNTPAAASPKPFDLTSTAFLIVAFLTGIAGALQTPTLSLFLTNEVHARPAMVGFFFTGSAIIGILVSQFLAGRSDRKGDRKSLIVFAVCWAFSPACCLPGTATISFCCLLGCS